MLWQLSFIYFTAVLSFMLEQIWFSEMQSSFWKVLSADYFLGGGGVDDNNPKSSLALPLVEVKAVSLLTSQLKVVGTYGYNCSSRSRFLKNKMHLAELDWKEQAEVYVLVCLFLTWAYCNAELYMYFFLCSTLRCFGMWVYILKTETIFYINA